MAASASLSEYVSRSELIDLFEGDAAFVDELATQFTRDCPAMLDAVSRAFDTGDAMAVSRAAHAFKGSLGYFDPVGGQALVESIEHIRPSELARVPALLRALELRIDALQHYLPREFGHGGVCAINLPS